MPSSMRTKVICIHILLISMFINYSRQNKQIDLNIYLFKWWNFIFRNSVSLYVYLYYFIDIQPMDVVASTVSGHQQWLLGGAACNCMFDFVFVFSQKYCFCSNHCSIVWSTLSQLQSLLSVHVLTEIYVYMYVICIVDFQKEWYIFIRGYVVVTLNFTVTTKQLYIFSIQLNIYFGLIL